MLNDPAVAERHALLTISNGKYRIDDIGSETGTFVNAIPAGRATEVLPTTPVSIGPFTLMLTDLPEEERETHPTGPQQDSVSQPYSVSRAEYEAEEKQQHATQVPQQKELERSAVPEPQSDASQQSRRHDPLAETRRSVKVQIHRELVDRLDIKRLSASRINTDELRQRARDTVRDIIEDVRNRLPEGIDPDRIGTEILNEALGLGPLEDLLADDSVTEIMVNGCDNVYVERAGKLQLTDMSFTDEQSVMAVIERIVSPLGRRVDESQPYVDARLADGSRVNCVIHPLSLVGPCITIRKFSKRKLFDTDLIGFGTLTAQMAEFLNVCVRMRKNIVVSGGTGSGKTTLLNVLSNYLPHNERILTIEDAAELRLNQPHLVRLEARPPNIEGRGAITIRDLVRNALRMRPDRIIVGECRGGEALDMLQAMNTGHDGSLTTVHANTPRDVISRLETMVLMSGMELPSRAIREQIASAVDIIVHESRMSDGSRKVTCISEVVGLEGSQITMQDIFEYTQTGITAGGKIVGHFRPTGAVPTFFGDLAPRGIQLDPAMFQPQD